MLVAGQDSPSICGARRGDAVRHSALWSGWDLP